MIRYTKKLSTSLILVCLLMLSACTSIEISKRHYRSGWHVSSTSKVKSISVSAQADTNSKQFVNLPSITPKLESSQESLFSLNLHEFAEKSIVRPIKPPTQNLTVSTIPLQILPLANTYQSSNKQKERKFSKHLLWFAFAPFLMLFLIPFKKLSRWASKHKRVSQISIVLSSFTLAFVALLLGNFAAKNSLAIPTVIGYSAPVLAILAMLFYPSGKNTAQNFVHRKASDTVLLTSGLATTAFIGNQFGLGNPIKGLFGVWIEKFISHASGFIENHFDFSRISSSADDQIVWLYVLEGLLIFLSVVVYLALLIATVFLSCNVSCSGNVAAGNAIIIGGLILFSTGLFFLIRTIHNQLRRKRDRLRGDEEFQ